MFHICKEFKKIQHQKLVRSNIKDKLFTFKQKLSVV